MIPFSMLLYRLRNRRAYRYFQEYSKMQWLVPEAVAREQFRRVQELVTSAYNNNSYYRELLSSSGIEPADIRTLNDFARIPVLTKEIIKQNIDRMVSREFALPSLIKNTSGGSTGVPLTFYQEPDLFVMMEANGLIGLSMAGWTGREKLFYFWGNPREFRRGKTLAMKLKERLSGRFIFNSYSYDEAKIAGWVEEIRQSGELILYGYTTVLADIARYIERQGIRITSVKSILSTAEKLYPWQRELLERSFGARVYDQYGSREVPGMACECEEGNMHLLSHSAYLEFADDPAYPGTRKIIATCLTNTAMPFIRYDIGDCGHPKAGTCPCGRGFPLMAMDIGRTADSFVTPEGGAVYGTFFVRQMYGQDRVKSFQFHQTAPDRITLHVVRGQGFGDDDAARLGAIEEKIRTGVSPAMNLTLNYVDEIPRTVGGKHRFVVSDLERR